MGLNMSATPDWSSLLDKERRLRSALTEAGEPLEPHALRQWWLVVSAVLKAMVRPDGRFSEQLPMELFAVLGRMAGYLAAGQVPVPIADVATKGRTSPGPCEVGHIQFAVTYRHLVDNKLIDDPHPVRTIMTAYGLRSPRTVQQWCKRHPPLDLTLWTHMLEALPDRMFGAGEAYRQANQRTWSSAQGARRARGARK